MKRKTHYAADAVKTEMAYWMIPMCGTTPRDVNLWATSTPANVTCGRCRRLGGWDHKSGDPS